MADKKVKPATSKPKRTLKRSEMTVRQRSEQAAPEKRRTLRSTAKTASTPFRAIGRFLAKIFRPLSFLLWPFKTRPARFIGRLIASILFFRYFRNSWKELRQVTWPDRKKTWQLAFAVFVFAVVFGLLITVVDYGLNKIVEKLFLS